MSPLLTNETSWVGPGSAVRKAPKVRALELDNAIALPWIPSKGGSLRDCHHSPEKNKQIVTPVLPDEDSLC